MPKTIFTLAAICLLLVVLTGCKFVKVFSDENKTDLSGSTFEPVQVQFQPSFTRIIPPDPGQKLPRRVEAFVGLKDQFGDPLKALGVFRFELFRHKVAASDARGRRFELGGIQEFDLTDLASNQQHWDKTTRYYRFELELPKQAADLKKIVLQVTFSLTAEKRFEDVITVSR